ncbi:hypothetical protein Q7I18_04540 [Aeromonas veronii]|uniref:hypothetical protein n=1 Tax=Aeromonas veronii TaxID=654 RepID=UPI003006A5A3
MIINITTAIPEGIQEYIDNCEHYLLKEEPTEFLFPEALKNHSISDSIWTDNADEVKKLNEPLLSRLRNKANIYAIFTKTVNGNWVVKYVGESKAVNMRERITSHLITKSSQTGSKLEYVREAVSKGEKIGLRFIYLSRDTLRTFVEEEIISKNKDHLPWNNHG